MKQWSTKINISFLALRKKNIQAFLENNVQKGTVELNNGYFGHMLNDWSIPDQFHSPYPTQHYSQSIIHTGMHTLTVHLSFVLHTNTHISHCSCTGSLVGCAEREWILKKHVATQIYIPSILVHKGDYERFHHWTPSTKELKGIFEANAPCAPSSCIIQSAYVHTHWLVYWRTIIQIHFMLEMYIGQDSGCVYGAKQETDRVNARWVYNCRKKLTEVIFKSTVQCSPN